MTEPLTPMQLNTPSPASSGVNRTLDTLSMQLKGSSVLSQVPSSAGAGAGRALQTKLMDEYLGPAFMTRTGKQETNLPASTSSQSDQAATFASAAKETALGALFPITNLIGSGDITRVGDMLSSGLSLFRDAQTLTPAERAKLRKEETDAANANAEAYDRHLSVREQLRALSDEEATKLGVPLAPGGMDPVTTATERNRDKDRAEAQAILRSGTQPEKTYTKLYDYFARTVRGGAFVGTSGAKAPFQLINAIEELATGDEWQRAEAQKAVERFEEVILENLPTDAARDKEFGAKVFEATGSLGVMLAGGLALRALGMGQTAAGLTVGGLPMAGQQVSDAEKYDATALRRVMAWVGGMGLGATDMIPIMNGLARANTLTGGRVARVLANTAATSMEEAIQEVGQDIGQDYLASILYDPGRAFDPKKYLETAGVMLVTGGLMGGGMSLIAEAGGQQAKVDQHRETVGQALIAASDNRVQRILDNAGAPARDVGVDPAAVAEAVGVDPAAVAEAVGVDPAAVAEAVGVDPAAVAEAAGVDPMALSAGTRDQMVGEQDDPGYVPADPANPPDAADADLNLTKIAHRLADLMDLTVRQGRLTSSRMGRVLGQWMQRTGVVRLRTWDDLSVLAHEAGHALNDTAGAELLKWQNANQMLLRRVAETAYPGDLRSADSETLTREGFAELFRLYTLNRGYALRHFPQATASLDAFMETNAPDLRGGLSEIERMLTAWLALPSTSRLRNIVVPARRPTGVEAAMKELADAGFPTVLDEYVRNTVRAGLNRHIPLQELVGRVLNDANAAGKTIDLARADDPYVLSRLSRNASARGMMEVKYGVTPYHGVDPATRSLRDALLVIHGLSTGDNIGAIDEALLQDFDAYLVALRALDEWRRFTVLKTIERPPINVKPGELAKVVAEYNAKYGDRFEKAAEIVNEFAQAQWLKAYQAGLISKETHDQGSERDFYAPLQRDMSDKAIRRRFGDTAVTQGRSIVKRFRGSDRNIISPMAVLMQKTFALEQAIARNDVVKAMAKLADTAGGARDGSPAGAEIERIPASQMQASTMTIEEAMRQLTKRDDISEADAAELAVLLQGAIDNDGSLALFTRAQAAFAGDNVLFFWEDGKLAALQLNNQELGSDVVELVTGLGRENMQFGMSLFAGTATAIRTSVTSWPDFLLVNFVRDQFSTAVLTDVGFVPFATGLRGVYDEVRQSKWARLYNQAGGIMGGMNVSTLHEARVNVDLRALRKSGYIASAFGEPGWLGAAKGLAKLTGVTETGTRLGVFRNAYNRAKADGLSDWDAAIEAAYTATDLIDFGLSGDRMLNARRVIPFLNAQLQGLYKLVRTLGGDEVARRRGLKYALTAYFKDINGLDLSRAEKNMLRTGRRAWVKMAGLAMFSAVLHFLFEDDPDYQRASEYLRDTGWVIPGSVVGEPGRIIWVPKPFETAILANAMERGLEAVEGDRAAVNRFMRGALRSLVPPAAPPAAVALFEQQANYDLFRDREIVPFFMKGLPPELQYGNHTSEFAKFLGQELGWSPLRIDHFMSALGTSAYRDLTGLTNQVNPERPNMTVADMAVARRFWRKSASGATIVSDFYNQVGGVGGRMEQASQGYKRYLEEGRERAADDYLRTLEPAEKAYALLQGSGVFKVDAKRLHPMRRAKDAATVISGMQRDIASNLGLDSTASWAAASDDPQIPLTAGEKTHVNEALAELQMRVMQNAMVTIGAKGWSHRPHVDEDSTIEVLRAINPDVADELQRRMTKKKIYSEGFVRDNWPDLRDRLVTDGASAYIDDLTTAAKATIGF